MTLVGANGAGKTTLLRTIVGLVRARAGEIEFDGAAVTRTPHRADRGDRLLARARGAAGLRRRCRCARTSCWAPTSSTRGGRRDEVAGGPRARLRPLPHPEDARAASSRGRSPAASSRCWPSGGRSWRGRSLMMLDEPSMGLAPLVVKDIFSIIAADPGRGDDGAARRAERAQRPHASPTAATCWRPGASCWRGRRRSCSRTATCSVRTSAATSTRRTGRGHERGTERP